jgi:aspartate kinase
MKFGGASVKDADSIRNVAQIMEQYAQEPMLVVISASGKTTNHLEELAFLARDGKESEAQEQFKRIRQFHLELMHDLFPENKHVGLPDAIKGYFEEMERIVNGILLLEEFPPRTYDRIVSYGELLSTTIVAEYLKAQNKDVIWLDARQLVKTDANYQQAGVIWSLTDEAIRREVWPQLKPGRIIITQGFIGSTTNGRTTTLGREGSDYTASIFATCLGAKSLTVWKDVPGILNADPRLRQDTIKIDNLSYEEAVEMTFYGATVIHPKTIKPIYNKHIPLHVKCFLDTSLPGTTISAARNAEPVTSYIVKKEQVFLRIRPKDFSFMEERLMQQVFDHLYKSGVKVNLVQNSAISLMLCLDDTPGAIGAFESLLLDLFDIEKKEGLKLYTLINFVVKDLKEAADAIMVQQHDNKLFIVK